MKILIVGEYSCFAKELKRGFVELGHECTIFTWGDGSRRIKGFDDDYYFPCKDNNIFVKLFSRIYQNIRMHYVCKTLKSKELYDIAIIVNPDFIRPIGVLHKNGITKGMITSLIKTNGKNVLMACGNDYVYNSYAYNFRKKHKKIHYKHMKRRRQRFENIKSLVSYIIPTHYDYAEAYRNFEGIGSLKLLKTIPLPVMASDYSSENLIKNDQITIFLGLMRDEKGYEAMDKAVKRIVQMYPNVHRIPNRSLPIDEYFIELSKANIVIDQCTGFSYGMHALFAMAMGKCVLSNNEPECRKEYGVDYIPIVNIKEDTDYIVSQLSYLIENPSEILRLGKEARLYCEQHHDSRIIAQRIIDNVL